MKLKEELIDSQQIGDFDEISSSIGEENIGLVLKMVSENLYSNPIGSFIREITSNGVDANKEAGVDKPIIIHFYKEEGISYLEFQDKGTGLNPEKYKEVYMKWFSSDKRNSNSLIGGWGIGSKSPLSYQDSFEITTVSEGIEYEYLFAKDTDRPKSILINSKETDKPNGTTIKVEIKEGDDYKISEALKNQLAYFNDVYVKDDIQYYFNDFKIYESEFFKLRSRGRPYTEMHISLGQVTYPINWTTIGINRIEIPVALKFEVGELDVTLSREEINYTDAVKETIKNRITQAMDYLAVLYTEQVQVEDLFEYYKLVLGDTTKNLIIEDVTLNVKDLKISPKFVPLDLKIKKRDIYNLFCRYDFLNIHNGSISEHKGTLSDIMDYRYKAYYSKERLNTYDTMFIGEGTLMKRSKISKSHINRIADLLELKNESSNNTILSLKPGSLPKIFKVIKYIDTYIENSISCYDGIATAEWIENYRNEQRELYEERKQTITFYNIYNNRDSIVASELFDKYKFLFYISKKEEKRIIVDYFTLFDNLPQYFKDRIKFLIINPTVINKLKRHKAKFVPVERIFKVGNLKSHFHRIKISYEIVKILDNSSLIYSYSDYHYKLYRKLSKHSVKIKEKYHEVPYTFANGQTYKQSFYSNLYVAFKEQIDNLSLNKGYQSLHSEENIKELNEFLHKMRIFNCIEKEKLTHSVIVDLISKFKVLRVNKKYYKY